MKSFSEMKLGDVVTFQRGFDITKAEQSPGAVPIVSSSGISSYHNKVKATAPGVIIGRKGTLGTVHFMGQDYWPHDTTLWVKDFKGNVPQFVAYFLRTLALENFDTGSSNPTLNRNHIHKIKILFPKDAGIQRKIAATLTAYDDLIEVNKRRIALLEKMAEELYREWFVRLRFPGYQDTRFVQGVPEGWKHSPIGDLTSVLSRGISPTYSDESARLVINQKCIRDGNIEWSHSKTHASVIPERKVLKDMDTLVNSTGVGTLGRSAIVWKAGADLTCDSHVTICRADTTKVAPLFLGYAVRLLCPYFEYLSIGATGQTELNQSFISKTRILVPTREVQQRFQEECFPLLDLVHKLRIAIANLTKTRDLLLPRLISGKLSVEDLDIQFPPSMQEGTEEQDSPPEARHA